MTIKQQIKQLTNTLDLCGLDYPKRDERDDLTDDLLYLELIEMVFCMNGLNMNDYIVEVN